MPEIATVGSAASAIGAPDNMPAPTSAMADAIAATLRIPAMTPAPALVVRSASHRRYKQGKGGRDANAGGPVPCRQMAGHGGADEAAPSAGSFRLDRRRRDAAAAVGRALRGDEFPEREDSVLVPLLRRGAAVATSELDDGLLEDLEAARMVRIDRDGSVTPLVRVEVWEGLLIADDMDRPSDLSFETVLGVNQTTRTMASLTPRRPVGRALDLGTGTGALVLRMAGHAETVWRPT